MESGVPAIIAWTVHGDLIVTMAYELEVVRTTAVSAFRQESEMPNLFVV
jgi:hypothetical protein